MLDILHYHCRRQNKGVSDDFLPFDLIDQHDTGIVVLLTVVPTSFMGVDSFDNTRFRLIAGHPSFSLQETELGGRDIVLSFV
jgi:hypothetical protein